MKPIDVTYSAYIDSSKEINNKNPEFKISDIIRISKYKNIFAKGFAPNWSKEVSVIKKIESTVSWKAKAKKLLENFMEKISEKNKELKK